jgi:hypothetical protein
MFLKIMERTGGKFDAIWQGEVLIELDGVGFFLFRRRGDGF